MSAVIQIGRYGIARVLLDPAPGGEWCMHIVYDTSAGPRLDGPGHLAVHFMQGELEELAWAIAELPGSTMYDEQDAPGEEQAGTPDSRQLELANVAQSANGG